MIGKILLTAAVVILGVVGLRRAGLLGDGTGKDKQKAVETMAACGVCGTYRAPSDRAACDREDCPLASSS